MNYDQKHVESFNSFLEPRQEGDIDLVEHVSQVLMKYGLKENLENFYYTDGYIIQAKNKRPEIQRYLINIYLTLQLMKSKKSSLECRYSLLPAGPIEDWIKVFDHLIAPFMADENLPTKI